MSDPEVLDVLRQWLRFAEEDLQTARTLLGQGGVPRTSCFHAQQAAEKAMKAIFVYSQVEYPYSHDLDSLRDRLPEGWEVKEKFPDLAGLTAWAVQARYPGEEIEASRQDAEDAVEQAGNVY
jgi:HEPN domain-containing protein